MNKDMVLGGYFFSPSGDREQLKPLKNPSEDDLLQVLELFRDNVGVLGMKNNACDDIGPEELSLYTESGRYMLLLGENDCDGEYNVRTLHNLNSPGGLQLMHGEPYGASTIVDDFDPVITAFREYLAAGNVSTDLLY
ncbi:DUF6911 family protein [Yersinia enterocolitica]|uniref:DUF6911 family protein n=1 Tax=Yersinia enterocolitica TaxID=630 RepID=UPI0005E8F5F2|nr:hypothetical protein [Yersinia enterocolitica]EKN3468749.1 hypothetical protein [Yersinia enterocolitica]EKN3469804.1 hypothetical protein [Yersinia enterocolitica]EKN3488402.1 hypothetical protein [Yersinia enterocolitica]EKN3570295.1 hypothetical protein [Yersinia enterocolitica]EKN3738913.1 hypothetical protein [Yersinia enterocolitica]